MPARCLSSSVAMIRNFWFTSGLRTLVGQFHTLPLCAWQSLGEHGHICLICPEFWHSLLKKTAYKRSFAETGLRTRCPSLAATASARNPGKHAALAVLLPSHALDHLWCIHTVSHNFAHKACKARKANKANYVGKLGKQALICLTMPYNALQCLTQKNRSTLRSWHQVLLLLPFARLRFNMIQLPTESYWVRVSPTLLTPLPRTCHAVPPTSGKSPSQTIPEIWEHPLKRSCTKFSYKICHLRPRNQEISWDFDISLKWMSSQYRYLKSFWKPSYISNIPSIDLLHTNNTSKYPSISWIFMKVYHPVTSSHPGKFQT